MMDADYTNFTQELGAKLFFYPLFLLYNDTTAKNVYINIM